jgi:hypothetical protein
MTSVVFHGLIEDLSIEAVRLATLFPHGSAHRSMLKRVIRVPRTTGADVESVFRSLEPRFAA